MGLILKIFSFKIIALVVAVHVALTILFLPMSACASTLEGIIKPLHEIELAVPIDGLIKSIPVKEGAMVKKGDVLLQLDDTLQQLDVARKKEIFLDSAEHEANKKNLEILKTVLASSKELYEKTGSVSLDELNNLQMQYHSLYAKVASFETKKKQEQIEYEISKEVLARYTLLSPISGIVSYIKHEEGEWAKAGDNIVTVVDKSICYVEFNLEDRNAKRLKLNSFVSIKTPEASKKAKVVFISPVADKASGLVRVKVEFDNADLKVTPGGMAILGF